MFPNQPFLNSRDPATQGLLGGIGLALCGLPGLFWGGIMVFTSLIPVAGNAVIWIPAAIYLFLSGRTFAGIFLSVWSILIVSLSDNITRPLFMKGGADMSTLMILLSILGGLNLFGMIGNALRTPDFWNSNGSALYL